ncbi:MAG: enoyl-CoA hydratase-related protein [Myxococcota bacterium]|nr:enoyl-CoA hydratase-related protein [Myxococcota bacterium]
MAYTTLKTEKDGEILVATIDRPEKLNAINEDVLRDLLGMLREAACDDSVRAVVLTGQGEKAFVAGADIAAMAGLTTVQGQAFADLGHAVGDALANFPRPVIAAVKGFALGGGCELACACDVIYAADNARFGQPEVRLGIIPGFGGTQRLARLVGIQKAKELIFSGDTIDAAEALRIGLVCAVFPAGEVLAKAKDLARRTAQAGAMAIAQAKRAVNHGFDLSLPAALELEKQAFSALFGTEDQKEGMAAFLAKRKPQFKGR